MDNNKRLTSREKKISKVKNGDDFHIYSALNKVRHLFLRNFKHSENRSKVLVFINMEIERLKKNFSRNENIGTSNQDNILELEQGLDNFELQIDAEEFLRTLKE